ncbi:hypothetical protein, partial [Arcticibacter sp.]|uniref:hypothetical protein n=1 Tax=Arcticibacter sp. TaxID=1872630 RepID=UPI00388DA0CD
MTKIILFFLSLSLLSCSRDSANYSVDDLPKEGIVLTSWRLVGPFRTDPEENGLETDFLKEIGSSEESIGFGDLQNIKANDTSGTYESKTVDTLNELNLDFNKIFNLKEDMSMKRTVYAGCTIQSSEEQILKLNFASDDGAKIWLNNKLIFSRDLPSDIHAYVNYIDLPLSKGENFLLIKVNNVERKWAMFAAIEKESKEGIVRHSRNFELQYGNYFLSKNIIENDTVKLTWGMPDGDYRLEIEGAEDTSFNLKINQSINISNLPDEGFYSTRLYARGDMFSSRFYKSKDINKAFTQLIGVVSAVRDGANGDTFKGLLHRYQLLMKPENLPAPGYQKRDWDKKMLFILENLLVQRNILKGNSESRYATGCL